MNQDPKKPQDGNATPGAAGLNTGMGDGLTAIEAEMKRTREALASGQEPVPAAEPPGKEEGPKTDTQPTTTSPEAGAAPAETDNPAGEPAAEAGAPEGGKPKTETKPQEESLEETVKRLRKEIRERDGRFGGEKQQLLAKTQVLEGQLAEALGKLAKVQKAEQEAARVTPPGEQEEIADPTDDQLRAAYGKDCIEELGRDYLKRMWLANRRMIRADRQQQDPALIEEIVERQLAKQRASDRWERAFSRIEAAVPSAYELNTNADVNGFGDYLDGYFGLTAIPRRTIATMAIEAIKSGVEGEELAKHEATLVSIFKGFTEKEGGVTPPGNAEGKPAATKPDPSKHIMPRTTGAERVTPIKDTLTQAEANAMIAEAEKTGKPEKVAEVMQFIKQKAAQGKLVAA